MILKTAGSIAGIEAFKFLINDLHQVLKKRASLSLRAWKSERQIEELFERIDSVRKVKTIWQVDKSVDIDDFYCHPHVVIDGDRLVVKTLTDFSTTDNLLIEGIAGQGKSIFLRYLCTRELLKGHYIPLFVELRRIDKDSGLLDRIIAAFSALGMDVDEDLLQHLAGTGKVLLLLDAFDEIPEDLKSRTATEIEDILDECPNLRVVATSRPQQTLRTSPKFRNVALDDLRGDEYTQVIAKVSHNKKSAEALIAQVQKKVEHIEDLLSTPLMVTLLVILYKSHTLVPDSLSDFYDALFPTLLQRHDGSKPGFVRHRRCKLDNAEYRRAFEAMCIYIKKKGSQSIDITDLVSLSQQALDHCNLKEKPSNFVKDIVGITCLVLQDGHDYRFIHKTVHEYYTASFIAKQPDVWAKRFYKRALNHANSMAWQQELEFLADIDSYRHGEYYFLPCVFEFLGCTDSDIDTKNIPSVESVVQRRMSSVVCALGTRSGSVYYGNLGYLHRDFCAIILSTNLMDHVDRLINSDLVQSSPIQEVERRLKDLGDSPFAREFLSDDSNNENTRLLITGSDLLVDDMIRQELCSKAAPYIDQLVERAQEIQGQILLAEDSLLLKDLL